MHRRPPAMNRRAALRPAPRIARPIPRKLPPQHRGGKGR